MSFWLTVRIFVSWVTLINLLQMSIPISSAPFGF